MTETIAAGPAQEEVPEEQAAAVADLRRTGIHPDFWYPVAVSASVRKKKTYRGAVRGRADRAVPRRERHGLRAGGPVRPPPGAAEHGRGGGRRAALLLSRLGLPRERPHLADPVPAQGRHPAAAGRARLPGARGLRPGVRLPRRPGEGGHGRLSRAAGVRLRPAQDDDVLAHRPVPLLVHAREPAGHEPPVPAPGHPGQDPAQAARLRQRPPVGGGPVPVHPRRREEEPRRQPARRRGHRRRQVARRHHHQDRIPVPDPPAGPGERGASGVLPLGGLRARGCRSSAPTTSTACS